MVLPLLTPPFIFNKKEKESDEKTIVFISSHNDGYSHRLGSTLERQGNGD